MSTLRSVRPLLLGVSVSIALHLHGQPLGSEFRINTYTTNLQGGGAVASDSAGNLVVVWLSALQDGSGFGGFGQRYSNAGAPLGSEFRVNTDTTNPHFGQSMALTAGGSFIVAWYSAGGDGSSYGVFAQRFTSAGAHAGPVFLVNTHTTSSQAEPSVAADSAGRFVIAWSSSGQDGSLAGVFAQRFDASGAPSGLEFQVNTFVTGNQRHAAVTSDPAGNFVVVWESALQDGSSSGVIGRRFDSSGSPLGSEFLVNTTVLYSQSEPAVSSDPIGNFIVVWSGTGEGGSEFGVFGQRYGSSGAPLGSEFRVNTYTTYEQYHPSIASAASGNFVVVWDSKSQDGSLFGVFGQRYGSSGAPLDMEFRVNTNTVNSQLASAHSVASDSAGNFVVVCDDDNVQDGSSTGVFGQRFCVPLTVVSISVAGSTTVTFCTTGGTATVRDEGGGLTTHQWGYRDAGAILHLITGQTGPTYLVNGSDFATPAPPGVYNLFCFTTPPCGVFTVSNEIPIMVTGTSDTTAPGVSAPSAATAIQSLCQ